MSAGRLVAAFACLVLVCSCGPREQVAEMKLARALASLQQGQLDEAARHLATVKPGGWWLRSPAWSAPLALRLRAQISLKLGAAGETRRLFDEYARRYSELGPAEYVRGRLAFLELYQEAGGEPALLYLRGIESEQENPARALGEWRKLLRDFPDCSLVPATLLRQGLLQARLGNDAWALASLGRAAQVPLESTDPDGNAVAPQARLAMGRIRRDLMEDRRGAREDFEVLASGFPDLVLRIPGEKEGYAPALSGRYEKALLELAEGRGTRALKELAELTRTPTAYAGTNLLGDVRGEARFHLAMRAMRGRDYSRARSLLVSVAREMPDRLRGPLDGARRWYGYEAVDRLASGLGRRAPEQALKGLEELASAARLDEMWVYARLQQVRLLARLGMQDKARDIQAEMARRFPRLDCDAKGDGILFIAAREAKRLLGGP